MTQLLAAEDPRAAAAQHPMELLRRQIAAIDGVINRRGAGSC
jgi:phage FluMu protein gp41